MAQEYEVLQFRKGDFQDQNGNYWCDMALKGVGEPVRIVVKDPTQFEDGMTLYGHITEETSKAGKQYQRFRREKRPEGESQPESKQTHAYTEKKREWQPRDDDRIVAQWAIGQSLAWYKGQPLNKFEEEVEELALQLFAMVDRVKGSSESPNPKAQMNLGEQKVDTTSLSGYQKFKASKPQPRDQVYNVPDKEEDVRSLVASGLISQGIPEDELPPGF